MSTNNEKKSCDTLAPVAVSIVAVAAKEIETLKQTLQEKENHILVMEQVCLSESEHQAELEDSIIAWQDKYDRLYESHKRVQKVNQGLEDKLLKLVDRNTAERAQLTSDVATLSVRLAQANFNISKLQREIERYKTDINLAIQLLQCKPDSFVPQKISSLPIDIQSKVSSYMRVDTNSHSDSEGSITGVGITTTTAYKVLPANDSPPRETCPFPPTAMVYSMRGLDASINSESSLNLANNNNNSTSGDSLNNNNNNNSGTCNNMPGPSVIQNSTNSLNNSTASGLHMHDNDMISPVLMAKFLHDELKAGETKHCDTCQCAKDLTVLADVSHSYSVSTQTPFTLTNSNGNLNDTTTQLCLRCYSNLNSPSRTNSPYNKNLLKSSDSVISETKSSVSDLNEMDKLFTPVKKDDLMVNPILGHHRIYDRPYGHKSSGLTLSTAAKLSYNTLLDNMKSTNSYQRRFVDGGGTALDLLEEKVKNTAPVKLKKPLEDINGNDDILDEQKPLLGPSLNENIPVEPAEDTLNAKTKLRTESSCELRRGVIRDHIKSPTASTKSALEASKTSIEGMVKSAMTGSLSSVWSRSSSCEGAKMFENFNRNLIKTIKAENPKNRGPRLCAMRIQQNGQSNILLDNMESIEAITPIIYRRRERLLDEELDDGKDIITSKVALANAKLQLQQQDQIQNAVETGKEALEIENTTSALATSSVIADGESEANVTSGGTDSERPPDQKEIVLPAKDEKTDKLVVETTKPEMTTAAPPPVTCDNSCKNSAGTQYSSMADNIDFQETVILRRQQLSRVAEWVQNNSKQMEREQQKMEKLNHCESSPTDQQSSSFSTLDQIDSVSVEKMSTDSGYKTTPQFQQIANSSQDETIKTSDESLSPKSELINEISTQFSIDAANTASNVNLPESPQAVLDSSPNTHIYSTPQTYYRRTSRSGLPVAYTASEPQDSSSQCSQIIATEQPTCDIVNYKYYPSDSDKNRSSQANTHASRTETVDIAQMEYNVKQFLLKQNEWSMRTATTSLSTAASTQSRTSTRPIKLFSSTSAAGFGPGKCERIINSGPNITHSSLGMMSTSNGACGGIPQRTETNL